MKTNSVQHLRCVPLIAILLVVYWRKSIIKHKQHWPALMLRQKPMRPTSLCVKPLQGVVHPLTFAKSEHWGFCTDLVINWTCWSIATVSIFPWNNHVGFVASLIFNITNKTDRMRIYVSKYCFYQIIDVLSQFMFPLLFNPLLPVTASRRNHNALMRWYYFNKIFIFVFPVLNVLFLRPLNCVQSYDNYFKESV